MKKFLIASAFAALAVTAFVSTASAQQAGGPNGRGDSSTDGGRDEIGCLTHVCDDQRRPNPRKIVAEGEGCGCNITKVRIGGRISYIQDCYFFDVKRNLERYCQPWERRASN